LEEGAANATINRELAALKRGFKLASQQTPPKLERVPHINMLGENNVRKGFFEHADFLAFRDALPSYLKSFVTFAYKTGWRESEIHELTWSRVDLDAGIVHLYPGTTKNDEGRTVFLDTELQELFKNQWEERRRTHRLTEYVLPNHDGTGKIEDFRHGWNTACRSAGLGYGYRLDGNFVPPFTVVVVPSIIIISPSFIFRMMAPSSITFVPFDIVISLFIGIISPSFTMTILPSFIKTPFFTIMLPFMSTIMPFTSLTFLTLLRATVPSGITFVSPGITISLSIRVVCPSLIVIILPSCIT
jgi:hypothetical protein